ncbi:MAG: hypothetical protein AAF824_11885 [Bacteroidota bacterium]
MVSTVQESDLVHIINQLFELEKKTLLMDNATSLQRPLRRIQQSMDRMGYRWENPLGDKFEDSRTDYEANIVGTLEQALFIREVIKPIIRHIADGKARLVQRGIVIVDV